MFFNATAYLDTLCELTMVKNYKGETIICGILKDYY